METTDPRFHSAIRAVLNLPADQRVEMFRAIANDAAFPAGVRAVAHDAWLYGRQEEAREAREEMREVA